MSIPSQPMEIAGQVVGGNVASILVRQKSDQSIELGDLLVADFDGSDESLSHPKSK